MLIGQVTFSLTQISYSDKPRYVCIFKPKTAFIQCLDSYF